MPAQHETFYEVMRRHGITRRSFLKFCSLTAAGLGLGPEFAGKIAHADLDDVVRYLEKYQAVVDRLDAVES